MKTLLSRILDIFLKTKEPTRRSGIGEGGTVIFRGNNIVPLPPPPGTLPPTTPPPKDKDIA